MTTSQLISTSIIIISMIAVLLLIFYFFRRDQLSRDKYLDRMLMDIRYERDDYNHSISRDKYAESRYAPELFDQILREIKRLRSVLSKELNASVSESISEALKENLNYANPGIFNNGSDILIREISHSLFTPLSQIEAAVISLSAKLPQDNMDQDIDSSLRSIRTSLAICKSSLVAFREQVSLSSSNALGWSVPSLAEMIRSAAQVYSDRLHRPIRVDVNMPDKIPGYSNNYLVAILMPLLENAVEASSDNGPIYVTNQDEIKEHIISIRNETDNLPFPDDIFRAGFSTKEGHEGIGLTVVQHLLAIRPGASISHHTDNNSITFVIKLPVRSEDEN